MKHMNYKSAIAGLAVLSVPFALTAGEGPQNKKNVLFIAIDDLKPLLGCYGDPIAETPNFDHLAQKGVIFNHAYCQQAISAASRASLLTGMRPDRTRVYDLQTKIRKMNPDVVTLPQYFKMNGYHATGIGKIYDYRSVDKNFDAPSWSGKYINQKKYLNKDYPSPIMSTYLDDVMKYYQSEEVRKNYEIKVNEAKQLGLKGEEADLWIINNIAVSNECADVPDDAYLDGATTEGAIDFLKHYDGAQPFFLAVGYKRPHLPFCAPKKYWDIYDRDEIPLAEFRSKAADSPDCAYHPSGELNKFIDISSICHFNPNKNLDVPEDKQKELIHAYYACVSYIDAQIGRLVKTLKKEKLLKNTIIVIWGDHGWHLGDHSLWNKHTNFENATHVPMIIIDPSIPHREINTPVEFLDIYPTLCSLCGLDRPSHVEGTDLSQVMSGKAEENSLKPYAVSQYPRKGLMGYTFRDQQYRYTVWVDWKKRKTNPEIIKFEELYDYLADPLETVNHINDPSYQKVLQRMKIYWEEYKQLGFSENPSRN